eukprot:508913-Rhodomonas_salina.1
MPCLVRCALLGSRNPLQTRDASVAQTQAYTANDVVDTQRKPLDEACPSPPDSPPWRAANEGGRLAMEPPPGTPRPLSAYAPVLTYGTATVPLSVVC